MITDNMRKHAHLEEILAPRGFLIEEVFPEIKNKDIITYDRCYNKFQFILRDICALANSSGGSIFIGVNNNHKCYGIQMKSADDWIEIMLSLSQIVHNTVKTTDDVPIKCIYKYYFICYENKTTYFAEIIVSKTNEMYILDSHDKISYHERRDGSTIILPLNEKMMLKLNEKSKIKLDIGDTYDGEENEKMEFKTSLSFIKESPDGIGKYISSFGNTNGGTVVVGVSDNGKIVGVRIDDYQEWEQIRQDIVRVKDPINDIDFLKKLKVERIQLKTKNYYLINIVIPKNTKKEPIRIRDKNGLWNKWVRVLSSSVRDTKEKLYSCSEYDKLDLKYAQAQSNFIQQSQEIELMRNNYSLLKDLFNPKMMMSSLAIASALTLIVLKLKN